MENLDMTEAFAMEMAALEKAVKEGKKVRLFFCNGYQAYAIVESFDMELIVCRKVDYKTGEVDRQHLWLVYRNNISTIEV